MYSSRIEEGHLRPPSADGRYLFGPMGYPYELATRPGEDQHLGALPVLLDQGVGGLDDVVGRATMASEQSVVATTTARKAPRRKPGKKDRHSKIPTAKGMRDRRMRLSLEIARKFFRLQDLLGYDKASKTVKWLMDNARPAINKLLRSVTRNLPASSSECEAFSNSNYAEESNSKKASSRGGAESVTQMEKGMVGSLRRVVTLPTAKESRDKARARARERTKEKNMKRRLEETAKEESRSKTTRSSLSHELESSLAPPAEAAELSSYSHEEHNLSASFSHMIQHSIPSIFDYETQNCLLPRTNSTVSNILVNHNNESGICRPDNLPGFWDSADTNMNSETISLLNIQSPVQFADLQFFVWPCELPFYNGQMLW